MVRAKNYKTMSTFVKIMPEYCRLYFADMVYATITIEYNI